MKILDIGEVSVQTGISPSTLRYYEDLGLISSVGRHGLRRQFGPEILLRLSLIAIGKSAGFSLEEIAGIFGAHGEPNLSRRRMKSKAEEIGRQIRELTALKKALEHAAECPAPSHMECPTFRRLLDLAVRRRKRQSAR